jgi:hypothetical protein
MLLGRTEEQGETAPVVIGYNWVKINPFIIPVITLNVSYTTWIYYWFKTFGSSQ